MHILFNILLTKIFNLMKKTMFFMMQRILGSKVLLFSVVFFFMGMASSTAQYVSNQEAITLLKGEVVQLEEDIPGASTQELLDLYFQIHYYKFIVYDLENGAEVGAAIYNNQPQGKLEPAGGMGVAIASQDPGVKQEIVALVDFVDELLSE